MNSRLLFPASSLQYSGSWLPLFNSPFGRERHDGDCGFWSLVASNFGGLFRSGKSLGPDWTVAATAPGSSMLNSTFGRERHDGDCGFWSLVASNFGGLFRSGKSLGPDWTVAATAPGSSMLNSTFGRERPRWRLRFLVVGREQLRRAVQVRQIVRPRLDSRRYRSWLFYVQFNVWSRTSTMATAVSGRGSRATSAALQVRQIVRPRLDSRRYRSWLFHAQFNVWSRTSTRGTAVSGRGSRATSAGSSGQANR
jgi:hypothetical protein